MMMFLDDIKIPTQSGAESLTFLHGMGCKHNRLTAFNHLQNTIPQKPSSPRVHPTCWLIL